MNTLALTLFALSQRPTAHEGDFTRLWQRDLTDSGIDRKALAAFAAEHPEAVQVDPGRIGNNLSYYFARDLAAWASVFGTADEGTVYDAMLDAGLDYLSPLNEAKALPPRLAPVKEPTGLSSYDVFGARIARVHAVPAR